MPKSKDLELGKLRAKLSAHGPHWWRQTSLAVTASSETALISKQTKVPTFIQSETGMQRFLSGIKGTHHLYLLSKNF